MVGTVPEATRGAHGVARRHDATFHGWGRAFLATWRPGVVQPDIMAHPAGRRPSRAPHRRPPARPRARPVDRPRDRRPLGRRAQGGDVRDARRARAAAPPRPAALSYGRGVSRGPGGGGGARGGSVRLRGADAQRAERLGLHARRPREHSQRRAPRGPAAARRLVRLRGVHHVLAGVPSAPVRSGRAAGPETLVAAQRPLPDPARAGHAGRDPAERLRPVGRCLAPPLPAIGIRMTAHPMLALLFAPSGQNASGGLTIFLVQIAALIAIFYVMLIRP